MPRRGNEMPTKRGGMYFWSDGTRATDRELMAIGNMTGVGAKGAGKGPSNTPGNQVDVIGYPGNDFMKPMGDDVLTSAGLVPQVIDPNAPGAHLDTTGADEQRQRTQALLAQLQQQATTGDGSWQDDFASAVEQSKASAQALGQAQPGASVQSSLMNIGNAQGAVGQRAVGEEQMLRAGAQLDARGQLSGLLGNQAMGDINQAAEESGVIRGRRSAQQELNDEASANRKATRDAIVGAIPLIGGMVKGGASKAPGGEIESERMSDGGPVPGRAEVFGDDEQNDTVRALLSPGEIVIPRSITKGPNAPQQAADFVRMVQQRRGPGGDGPNFAGGGETGLTSINDIPAEMGLQNIFAPTFGNMRANQWINDRTGTGIQGLSTTNGSLLNDEPYRETAAQQEGLAGLFGEQAAGAGPSMAPAMAQRSTDNSIAGALQAQQQGATQAIALQQAAAQGANMAGDVGRQAGMEQSRGQQALGGLRQQMRGQESALATGKQRAAWANTLSNAGLGLEQQAQLRGTLSGLGQTAAGIASMGGGRGGGGSNGDTTDSGYNSEGAGPAQQSEFGDYSTPDVSDGDYAAKGGVISAFNGAVMPGVQGVMPPRVGPGAIPPSPSYYFGHLDEAPDGYPYASPGIGKGPAPGPRPVSELPPELAGRLQQIKNEEGPGVGRQIWEGAKPGLNAFPLIGDAIRANDNIQDSLSARAAERAARPAGVTPKKDADAATQATEAPVAQQQQPPPPGVKLRDGAGRVGVPGDAGAADARVAMTESEAAEAAMTEASIAKGKAHAEGLAAAQGVLERKGLERADLEQRAGRARDDAMAKLQTAQDEMSRIDTTVDPGRFWASRDTGQRVLGILGLVLGGIGAGKDGVNRAAVLLDKAIDRDIDAQKAQTEASLRKGGRQIDAAQSFYSAARQATGDEFAAHDASKAMALEQVANQAAMLEARTQAPEAKAALGKTIAAIHASAAQLKTQAGQRTFDNSIKAGHLANESAEVSNKAAAATGAGGGAKLPPGEAKDLHDAEAAAQDSLDLIKGIRGGLKKTGTSFGIKNSHIPVAGPIATAINQNVGGDAAKLDSDQTALVLKLKDVAKLGAISGGDRELLDRLTGDPSAIFTMEGTKSAKLDALEGIVRRSIAARRRSAQGIQAQ